ncbi:right-handed parallel beta-helix repeat-containing protein [Haloferax sp. ATB1]|uniref:right-handed parallel beta-helix repeat-containing protein n=1 Tax=Haloferax sp. ATB1 TaxID=1508454 RepID=UPI0018E31958|nr:right-handed parallel beta-helix repeat-containing protein [Haloferax sp. ATB1]
MFLTSSSLGWTRRILVVLVVVSLFVPLASPAAAAQSEANTTFVESDITADTTWTPEDGPYRIIQSVHIDPGTTLTIRPGTDVQLAEGITLSVDGSLVVDGTVAQPVTISRSEGAAAERRWASIRYNGTSDSRLVVRNTTLQGGTSGVTVTRADGSITITDSAFRDFSNAGVSVGDTASTPPITIERSAFRRIDGHAIRATPLRGATGETSVTASPATRDNRSNHTLSLDAGVGVTFDTIELRYADAGSVDDVDAESIARIGLDSNRNGTIERSFDSLVTDVSGTDGRVRISLSRPVSIPSDGRLLVEYGDVLNPETRGIYPVAVDLRKATVSQLSDGVRGSLVVGNITSPVERADPTTRVRQLTVRESTFRDINGSGVFAAADGVGRLWLLNNEVSATAGSGIAVRAARSDTTLLHNHITAGDAGIQLDARDETTATVAGNEVRGARTGIRIRQSGTQLPQPGAVTIRDNTLADNVGHGVDLTARSLELNLQLTDNAIRGNGGDAVHVNNWLTRGSDVRGNRFVENGGDGFALDGTVVSGLTLADNTVRDNEGTGLEIQTGAAARGVDVLNNTVHDNEGHAVSVRSNLIIHRTNVSENRLANNAGAGLLVASPITHRGKLSVANNTIAANSYGVVVRGVVETDVRDNDIVFNTNAFADPVLVSRVTPGTGVYVAEGASGAIINQAESTVPLEELVANPELTQRLTVARLWDDTVVVLRTDGESETRSAEASALTIRRVSGALPTGIGVQTAGEGTRTHHVVNNSIYGQERGLTVDIEPLVSANATARIVVDPIRTVDAESNYWGAASGPYHSSILPSGEGNPVVTERGWVDFTPFRTAAPGGLYARPTARIDAPATASAASQLRLSGAGSTGDISPVGRYHFFVNGTERVQSTPELSVTMGEQPLDVGLAVESRLGIDSDTVTTTIGVAPPEATPTMTTAASPNTAGATTTAQSPTNDSTDGGFLGGLASVWGLLGGGFYVGALGLGGYGMVLTLQRRSPPVSGLRIQLLAGAAVLVWLIGGLVGTASLVGVGLAAGVAWAGLTGVAYILATRG